MQTASQIVKSAQTRLNRIAQDRADEDDEEPHPNDFRSRLMAAVLGNGLCIEYFGEVWDDTWEIVLETLAHPVISSSLTSLRITGPDEGANGTRGLDFGPLLATGVRYPRLLELFIRPTDVGDHNMVVIDDGHAPSLVERCVSLLDLTLPHAPEAAFFACELPVLRCLRTGMGHFTHDFIANLAHARNLPSLQRLDFTDSLSVFRDDQPTEELPPDTNTACDDRYTSFEPR